MAAVTVTVAQIGRIFPESSEIVPRIAAVAITAGAALYQTTAGLVGLCDANDSGKEQFAGLALNAAAAGGAVSMLIRGEVYGFTLSGNAGDLIYQADTPGVLDTAASGTKTVVVGKIVALTDHSATPTKVLRVDARYTGNW